MKFLTKYIFYRVQQKDGSHNFWNINLANKFQPMGLLNQQNKKGDKKSTNKNLKNSGGSKFISKGSKPAGGGVNKKGLTGGSRGS